MHSVWLGLLWIWKHMYAANSVPVSFANDRCRRKNIGAFPVSLGEHPYFLRKCGGLFSLCRSFIGKCRIRT